jgi:hypothetical protein
VSQGDEEGRKPGVPGRSGSPGPLTVFDSHAPYTETKKAYRVLPPFPVELTRFGGQARAWATYASWACMISYPTGDA